MTVDLRRSDRLDRLLGVLARLDAPSRPVSELLTAVPELVRELGFDRASVTRIQDGAAHPQVAEMMRDLRPILISGPPSYVAAPIVSGGSAVGVVHADCRLSGRNLDEVDRDLLAAFAVGLRMALSASVLHEQLLGARDLVAQLSSELRFVPGEIGEMPAPGGAPVGGARPGTRLPDTLTSRELEVLALMAAGCTNSAIAERLRIAEGTAKKHVFRVLRKLGVTNRAEAVARWFHAGGASRVLPSQ